MVESTGLEIRRSRKATEGSNPSLSAIRRASLAHGQDHSSKEKGASKKRGECPERNVVESKGSLSDRLWTFALWSWLGWFIFCGLYETSTRYWTRDGLSWAVFVDGKYRRKVFSNIWCDGA